MINAPASVVAALESGNFSEANLITINLGDVYDTATDLILYLTDYGHDLTLSGDTYTNDEALTGIEGISRKASTGSDKVDVEFSVTDPVIVAAIRSERYVNKPTSIDRVIVVDGVILEDYKIPVRTAWAIAHNIQGDLQDQTVTLVIDSTLGALDNHNGWFAVNSSHESRYPGDKIMKHGPTVFTEEQQKKYTTNFNGVINNEVKPPSLPKIYGYKNVIPVPICMLKHRKTHSTYRHYYTTFIYVIGIGEMNSIDSSNLRRDGEDVDMLQVTDTATDQSGWSFRIRTPTENLVSIKTDTKLNFWRDRMDANELNRLDDMFGKGLTLLFVLNRNRDDWLNSAPEFSIPCEGSKVFDPRTGTDVFSRNPGLQYADFLRSTEYGAGLRATPITDANITEIANHFDTLPGSTGNPGINSIKMDIQLDTGDPLVDNMNVWIQGARMYTSDYYGVYNVRVETIATSVLSIHHDDCEGFAEYDSGEFTDKLNQLTYTVKQLVPDTSTDAEAGDLVEVDVEATFPADGSATHIAWLAEDGGIPNYDSEALDYVTELEQALFHCMVDVRVKRKPATLSIFPGTIAWLLEVGDVIDYTDPIIGEDATLWRIESVSEDDGENEISCVPYDDGFYSPDPNVIPAPTAPAKPPTDDKLLAVIGLEILNLQDLYYLNFTPLADGNVSYYAVEIYETGSPTVLLYDEPKLAAPPLMLPNITSGDYVATVVAVGVQNEGVKATYAFTISDLVTSTTPADITGTVPGRIVVEPPTPSFDNRTYEWRYFTNEDATVRYWGDGLILNLTPIVEDVTYTIEYRLKSTVSNVPPGAWVDIQVNGIEQLFYTWQAYADDINGGGISQSYVGKDFYGIATGKTISQVDAGASSVSDPSIFEWRPMAEGGVGEPALSAYLTSESAILSADENGTVKSYAGVETTMTVFLGAVDVTGDSWNISATTGTGVTGNLVGQTFTVTGLTVDQSTVTLTATKTAQPTLNKVFTLTRVIDGVDGPQGVQGPQGPDGIAYYTWIRYADSDTGTGISNSPTNKTYIGFAYNKTTATESNDPNDYTWSLIQGPQGNTGVQGPQGPDGDPTYTWIKYSANSDGTGLTDLPQGDTEYIGIATNKTTATESNDKTDYIWSLFRGPQGVDGAAGIDGIDGIGALPASISPAKLGGSGDFVFILDYQNDVANEGEIQIEGNRFFHPDGTERTITNQIVNTNFGEGKAGIFYLMWTDTLSNTRYPALVAGGLVDGNIVAIEYANSIWRVINNTGQTVPVNLVATDCIIAAVQAQATTGGLTGIVPFVSGAFGLDGDNGLTGSTPSLIYKLVTDGSGVPATPTGGTFDGTTETIPTGWTDNPTYGGVGTEYVSRSRYNEQTNGSWTRGPDWSAPSVFAIRGQQGNTGPVGPSNPQTGTFIKDEDTANVTAGTTVVSSIIVPAGDWRLRSSCVFIVESSGGSRTATLTLDLGVTELDTQTNSGSISDLSIEYDQLHTLTTNTAFQFEVELSANADTATASGYVEALSQ